MTPAQCIAALDNALAANGEDVILRRVVAGVNVDVVCRAMVSAVSLQEVSQGVVESDQHAIISMTQIRAHGWPNQPIHNVPPYDPDPALPLVTDAMIIQGRLRKIAFVDARRIDNVIVRVNLRVTG